MNHRAARLILAVAVALASLLNVVGPSTSAIAEHLPPPSEIVVRAGELPPGFLPATDEANSPSLLPDGLARQATAAFRRDPERAAEPGVSYIKQVVLTFDERDATEYLPRFRDLMLRHQGYAAIASSETDFQLTRTRGAETSVVVGMARGEVLVVTTIAGQAGTVTPGLATQLTGLAVARVPVVHQSSAALSTASDGGLALSNANTGGSYFEFPTIEEAGRYPTVEVNLPKPPDLDVVAPRSQRPVGDPSLNGLVDVHPNRVRPPDLDTNLMKYIAWISPLIDEFWARALGQTGYVYQKPRVVIVAEGTLVLTGCIDHDGLPALADSLSYCGPDRTVYIYEPFMKHELIAGQDWQQRDFVIATVMAHEWGHHIQAVHNYDEATAWEAMNRPELQPIITRGSELQADCFAGLFARYARDAGWLTISDIGEAQEAMLRAGDHHVDHPGHHGTPEQRKEWFMRGYVHYSYRACDAW